MGLGVTLVVGQGSGGDTGGRPGVWGDNAGRPGVGVTLVVGWGSGGDTGGRLGVSG